MRNAEWVGRLCIQKKDLSAGLKIRQITKLRILVVPLRLMDQKVEPLTEKENAWISVQLQNASSFVEAYSPSHTGQPVTLAGLDRAFAAWIATKPTDPKSINAIINCVGVAFGRFLVEGAGFEWVIATDKHGSDLAIYALPGTGDVLVYPTNFVAKRWESRTGNFLAESYDKISAQVQKLRHTNI
jgi:Domain of unknown function (DUF3806)